MHPGLLLVNLGSPASPRTKDVKTYLQEFLSDPSVIEMPAALWQPLLRGIILPTRSWRSATFYQDSWLPQGSPLMIALYYTIPFVAICYLGYYLNQRYRRTHAAK
ncbi:hypothetical protein WP50_07045 [Lactiplantibacillus plantarum]|nr:hypothetical protein WP50_07045 [Lactiplantibacillus plantarum]